MEYKRFKDTMAYYFIAIYLPPVDRKCNTERRHRLIKHEALFWCDKRRVQLGFKVTDQRPDFAAENKPKRTGENYYDDSQEDNFTFTHNFNGYPGGKR